MYSWENKVVLITGAANGIGAKVVKLIANENIKHVAILDVDEAAGIEIQNELNSHASGLAKFYKCDVTNEEALLNIFDDVKQSQGHIDVVINNAGIMNDSPSLYKKQIEINFIALVTSTLKAVELMRKDKGGRGGTIINVSSIASLLQTPMMPIYFATKSAVLQFSNCLGLQEQYTRQGVRIMVLCIGKTDTSLLEKMKCFDPDLAENTAAISDSHPIQTVDSAAKGLVEAFKQGTAGSTWLIANNKEAVDISDNIHKGYDIMMTGVLN